MASFKIGIPSSSLLYRSLTKKEAMTIDDLMARIDKYAKVDDVTHPNTGENGRAKLTTKVGEKTENQTKGGKNGGKMALRTEGTRTRRRHSRRSTPSSKNQFIRFSRRSRMSHSSSGPGRWEEIPRRGTMR